MEGEPLPAYARVRRFVAWRDAAGRLYAPAVGDGADSGAAPGAPPECCYVLLPMGETRRRGAPGSRDAQIEFPEPGERVVLTPSIHSACNSGGVDTDAGSATLVVDAVERRELERAVALVTWRLPASKSAAPAWLR